MILGIILVIIGLWLLMPLEWGGYGWWQWLEYVLMGIIPAFLVFIGAILVWIEWEEAKIEKPTRRKR